MKSVDVERLNEKLARLVNALEAMVEAGEFEDWDGRSSAQDNARAVLASVKGEQHD